jgi:hypothetical protein
MKQDIFTQVGKQTPFRTPEGFFVKQKQALKKVVSPQKSIVRPLHRKWWYAAAASVILIGGIYGITRLLVHPSDALVIYSPDSAPIYSQTSSVSDDWSDFADADVFLDNMNW